MPNYKEITPSISATSLYFAMTSSGFFRLTVTEILVYVPFFDFFDSITAPVLSKMEFICCIFPVSVGTMNLYR